MKTLEEQFQDYLKAAFNNKPPEKIEQTLRSAFMAGAIIASYEVSQVIGSLKDQVDKFTQTLDVKKEKFRWQ